MYEMNIYICLVHQNLTYICLPQKLNPLSSYEPDSLPREINCVYVQSGRWLVLKDPPHSYHEVPFQCQSGLYQNATVLNA